MLGRPERAVPQFMNVWAGSWLICSVTMLRTMASLSTKPPSRGKKSLTGVPLSPFRENVVCGPRQTSFFPCNCAIGWPAVTLSGISWPSSFSSTGL